MSRHQEHLQEGNQQAMVDTNCCHHHHRYQKCHIGRVYKWLTIAVEEFQTLAPFAGQLVNTFNNITGHWELSPAGAIEQATSVVVKEVVTTLGVARWLHCDGAGCVWSHSVVMVLVYLCVCSIFNTTMFGIIDAETGDNSTWAENVRHTICVWESIQPECAVVDEFNNHPCWDMLKWQSVVYGPYTLF
jgi:hypothetical protein